MAGTRIGKWIYEEIDGETYKYLAKDKDNEGGVEMKQVSFNLGDKPIKKMRKPQTEDEVSWGTKLKERLTGTEIARPTSADADRKAAAKDKLGRSDDEDTRARINRHLAKKRRERQERDKDKHQNYNVDKALK